MRSNWNEVPKGDVPANSAAQFSVTMNPRGQIMMSLRTWRNLGEPKAVQVLFDNINSRIGLKPAAPTARNAYRVGPVGPSGGKQIRALRLITEWRIDLPHTVKFVNPETDEDGILMLDLRTTKPSTASASNWKRRAKRGS